MGCGKTSAGRLAADKLRMAFIDLDVYISEQAQLTIPEIFAQHGEPHFRKLETAAISEIVSGLYFGEAGSPLMASLVALGGGAIINPDNAEIINSGGISIFLDVDFSTCYERIKNDPNRPLAYNSERSKLEELYINRKRIYTEHSQFAVDGNANLNTIAERIIKIYNADI